MDEPTYQRLADDALARIEDAFKDIDSDVVDCERSGDVVTLTFGDGKRCVVNTQRPTRQLWLAANARAWHFSYRPPTSGSGNGSAGRWVDDKDASVEIFEQIRKIVRDVGGIELELG